VGLPRADAATLLVVLTVPADAVDADPSVVEEVSADVTTDLELLEQAPSRMRRPTMANARSRLFMPGATTTCALGMGNSPSIRKAFSPFREFPQDAILTGLEAVSL
jgi:hypothetical protein